MLPFIRYYYCLIFNFIKQPLLCHIQFFKRVIDLNTPGLKYLEWIPLSTELNQTPSLDFGKHVQHSSISHHIILYPTILQAQWIVHNFQIILLTFTSINQKYSFHSLKNSIYPSRLSRNITFPKILILSGTFKYIVYTSIMILKKKLLSINSMKVRFIHFDIFTVSSTVL